MKKILLTLGALLLAVVASPVYAEFAPGQTLDPGCAPTTSTCTVTQISVDTSTGNFGVGTTSPYAKLSVVGQIVGSYFTGTTTATSTLAGGLSISLLNVSSTTASSTFANGINLTGGCFSINGTCLSTSGGGSGTVNSGAIGQTSFYAAAGTALTATSSVYIATTSYVGVNTQLPLSQFEVNGNIFFSSTTFGGARRLSVATSTSGTIPLDLIISNANGFSSATNGSVVGGALTITAGTGGVGTSNAGAAGGVLTLTGGPGAQVGNPGGAGGAVVIAGGAAAGSTSGAAGGAVSITGGAGAGNSSAAGGALTFTGGAAAGSGSNGGAFTVVTGAGAGTGVGGNVSITVGASGSNAAGGTVTITSGAGVNSGAGGLTTISSGNGGSSSGAGGALTLNAGSAAGSSAAGGVASLFAGNSTGNTTGGTVKVYGGNGGTTNGAGGDVYLYGGTNNGSGAFGNVLLQYNGSASFGKVGVGTSTPYGFFSIHATSSIPSFVIGSSTATTFIVDSMQNIGIATSVPWRTFSVNGTMAFNGLTSTGATSNTLCIDAATKEVSQNNAATCTVSSLRFKHDVLDLNEGLNAVMALRPVSFKLNSSNEDHIGFIAEEVNLVDPRLVFYDYGTTVPRGVRYEEVTALLAKAIQEHEVRIKDLESRSFSSGGGISLASVLSSLESLGTKITDGLITVKNLLADQVTTKKLCLDDVCVTKDQLQTLLQNANLQSTQVDMTQVPLTVTEPAPTDDVPTESPTEIIDMTGVSVPELPTESAPADISTPSSG